MHQNRAALAEKNDVCLLTKHDNNSLNLWRLQIDEQCEQGHGFGVRRKEQAMPFLIVSVLHEYRMCEEQKSEGGTLLEVLNKDSLIDVTQLENPLLPQYHPIQLVGLLNAGRIQRVRAILLNILRSICQRQQVITFTFQNIMDSKNPPILEHDSLVQNFRRKAQSCKSATVKNRR